MAIYLCRRFFIFLCFLSVIRFYAFSPRRFQRRFFFQFGFILKTFCGNIASQFYFLIPPYALLIAFDFYSTFYFSVFCLYTILLQDFVCVLIYIAKSLLLDTTKSIKSIKSRFVLFFRLFKRFMHGKQTAILQNRLQKRGCP